MQFNSSLNKQEYILVLTQATKEQKVQELMLSVTRMSPNGVCVQERDWEEREKRLEPRTNGWCKHVWEIKSAETSKSTWTTSSSKPTAQACYLMTSARPSQDSTSTESSLTQRSAYSASQLENYSGTWFLPEESKQTPKRSKQSQRCKSQLISKACDGGEVNRFSWVAFPVNHANKRLMIAHKSRGSIVAFR